MWLLKYWPHKDKSNFLNIRYVKSMSRSQCANPSGNYYVAARQTQVSRPTMHLAGLTG